MTSRCCFPPDRLAQVEAASAEMVAEMAAEHARAVQTVRAEGEARVAAAQVCPSPLAVS